MSVKKEKDGEQATSSAAFWIASPMVLSMPYVMLTSAAAFFNTPKALIKGTGILSVGPPISKFCTDLLFPRKQSQLHSEPQVSGYRGPLFEVSRRPTLSSTDPAQRMLVFRRRPRFDLLFTKPVGLPLCLSTIISVRRNLKVTERVLLYTELLLPRFDDGIK